MSPDEIKAIVSDEVYNQGNLDLLDQMIAPDLVYHDPLTSDESIGSEA